MGTSARVPSIAALLGIVLIWSIASTALAVVHESSWWLPKFGGRVALRTERETPGQIAVTGKAKGVVARPDKSQQDSTSHCWVVPYAPRGLCAWESLSQF